MIKCRILFLSLLLPKLLTGGLYGDSAREFVWRIPLSHSSPSGEIHAGTYYSVPIPRDVYSYATTFPRDLRIFDENGTAWPFFLQRPKQSAPVTETLSSTQRNALESFDIHTLRVERITTHATPPLTEHSVTRLPETATDPGIQQIHLDLGLENQPFQAIELHAEGRDYLRRVNVYTRNHENVSWRGIGGGDIFQIEALRQNRIQVSGSGRFIRLDIHNHDDPALDIQNLRVFYRTQHLITQAPASPAAPALYFGSERVEAPRYDIDTRWNRLAQPPALLTLHPGPLEANPAHRAGISPNILQLLSIVIIAATSGLVIWIIYRMMTNQPKPS